MKLKIFSIVCAMVAIAWAQDATAVSAAENADSPDRKAPAAEQNKKPKPHRNTPGIPNAVLRQFDRNNDGVLDESEIAALQKAVETSAKNYVAARRPAKDEARRPGVRGPMPQIPPEVIKAFDKDGDGKLSPEEREQMRARLREIFQKYDAGNKGRLSPEEIEKAVAENPDLAMVLKKYAGPRPEVKGKSGNPANAPKPHKNAGAKRRGPRPPMPPSVIKAFDKDGDGKLSKEEMPALHQSLKEAKQKYDKDGDGKLNAEERAQAAKDPVLGELFKPRPKPAERPSDRGKGKAPAAPEAE